jgi:hypothetical protein
MLQEEELESAISLCSALEILNVHSCPKVSLTYFVQKSNPVCCVLCWSSKQSFLHTDQCSGFWQTPFGLSQSEAHPEQPHIIIQRLLPYKGVQFMQ